MQTGLIARLFFAIVATMAAVAVVSGTGCTRWGQPGPVTPTLAPLTDIYVDAVHGSDTSGNGSQTLPYKTLTKAVAVLTSAKSVAPGGVTIHLAIGDYNKANGEIFPIVVPKSVTIAGENYGIGSAPKNGSFVDGVGEDVLFESLVHAPPRSAYATLEVEPPASVGITDVYLGASTISLPSNAFYASLDDFATFSGTTSSLAAGIASSPRNVNGAIVPGGSFSCASCLIHGNDFGVGAFAVPLPSASPYGSSPSITLSRSSTDSTIAARVVDVLTDGSVNVTASDTTFARAAYAYADAFKRIVLTSLPGAVDFGGGVNSSVGGNGFIGARRTEIFITRRNETVSALDDTWNPGEQHANMSGQYTRVIMFASGATGKNVTIRRAAVGSTVTVGPAAAPTPTPSASPSSSPTSSPT
ncbi:MAG: DUF1565 domain-containing protein [Candidatus Eremiobacteraeota bacterium]|nr:DUF1565 domain-containing protein [Candidatus Eremiobacteraeota bacterium]